MGKIFYLIIYQFVCLAAREPNKIIFFFEYQVWRVYFKASADLRSQIQLPVTFV